MREGFMECVTLGRDSIRYSEEDIPGRRKSTDKGPKALKRSDLFRDFKCFRVIRYNGIRECSFMETGLTAMELDKYATARL